MLTDFGVENASDSTAIMAAAQRFIEHCSKTYDVTQWLAEYPITYVNEAGQEISGFIDLLLETTQGWIIIDHKSSPAPKNEWSDVALGYSGQLAVHREVVEAVAGKPVVGCWVHLVIGGGMVEVVFP